MNERKPDWLRTRGLGARKTAELTRDLRELGLHTVCESARCPNRGECFERGVATFILLGDICTRACRFCAVPKDRRPEPLDPNEPQKIADLTRRLKLRHVVLTMVTRDDLPDGGAAHVAETVANIRIQTGEAGGEAPTVEILVSDFLDNADAWRTVFDVRPDIFNHNVETVPRLYPEIRPQADYQRSLRLLNAAWKTGLPVKSGFMVGLGETESEVARLLGDLREHQVEMVTIGQYLAPSPEHAPVVEYVTPDRFDQYGSIARGLGFSAVESAPLVRSSYHADRTRDAWRADRRAQTENPA
jgi:lipoyl synthase